VRFEHPDISEEMWTDIEAVVLRHRDGAGAVITVLRECQNVVGYLPVELIDAVAAALNLPPSDVYGVASFYSLFSLKPKGRHTIQLCLGTACYVKGIKDVMSRITSHYDMKCGETASDRRFSLEGVRCVGACGLAPVMVVDKDTHGDVTSDRVLGILDKYK
jgi:NADH:ubiquinone oxidoreductase subunit E